MVGIKLKAVRPIVTAKSLDIGANLLDKSKQKAGGAAAYIADKYSITRDGVSSWSAENTTRSQWNILTLRLI